MSDFDGLRHCEECGNYTTGRLCTSCAHQEMIDNYDGDYGYDYEQPDQEALESAERAVREGGYGEPDEVAELRQRVKQLEFVLDRIHTLARIVARGSTSGYDQEYGHGILNLAEMGLYPDGKPLDTQENTTDG